MVIKINKESADILEENTHKLMQLFPSCFSEGKLNFKKLEELLKPITDTKDESYSFSWAGRTNSIKNIQTPAKTTLIPQKDESVNFDDTENIFIEGENLEVLKLLQKSYSGKIKMIYIDPPYNTGNDFVYDDDFTNSIPSYLEQTGQSEDGVKLTSNPETSGRFHSDWLSFMYPRLFLAKNLLLENGVMAISIGDRELSNLIQIMNLIFGEENQIAIFLWKSRAKPTNAGDSKYRPQKVGEYIVVYGKNFDEKIKFNVMSAKQHIYPHTDKDGKFRTTTILTSNRGTFRRETMRFESNGYKPDKDYRWKAGKEVIDNLFATNRILFTDEGYPMEKKYEHEESDPHYPIYTFMDTDISGTAEIGKMDLNDIIGNKHGLDTVKPVQLMKYLCSTFSLNEDIILDFFAGSCTISHAILELNLENNENRKYIVVQIPEKIDELSEAFTIGGFKTISQIGKTRIKNVLTKLQERQKQQTLVSQNSDLGFKVFKLAKSNYKIWDDVDNEEKLKEQLKLFENPLIENYEDLDVIYEIIIKEGYSLNSKIEDTKIKSNQIYKVTDDEFHFFLCLDKQIKQSSLDSLNLDQTIMFVCLDSALDDSQKSNLSKICKLRTI